MLKKSILVIVGLCLLGSVAGFGAFEIYVRRQLWRVYAGNATPMMVINQSLSHWKPVDDFFGRNPLPGLGPVKARETITTSFVVDGEAVFQSRVHTNNLGFLSDKPYSVERPKDHEELRVYFAGDSMTGPTTMDFQWVDLVEDVLNANQELRAAVGGKVFKTYNGGVPGADFKFFWNYFNDVGRKFAPDMVVVNYIESDFPRMGKSGHEAHTDDESMMIDHASTFSRKFVESGVPTIFTQMPLYQDIFPKPTDLHLSHLLEKSVPGMRMYYMRDRLPWQTTEQTDVRGWYNLPYDGHMSEEGGIQYALVMAGVIAEHLTGRKDFSFSVPPGLTLPGLKVNTAPQISDASRKDNLLPEGLFRTWLMDEEARRETMGGQPVANWHVVADGGKGTGRLRVVRRPAAQAGLDGLPADASTMSVETVSPSTAGVPSLQSEIRPWRALAGHTLAFRLRMRAPDTVDSAEVKLQITANYGSGKGINPERSLFQEGYTLRREWRTISFAVPIPASDAAIFGKPDSEIIRVQLMSAGLGQAFNVEIADPIAVVADAAADPSRATVFVGDRSLPAKNFAALRADINRRYREARLFSLRSYAWYRLTGKEPPYGYLPVGVPYVADFIPLTVPGDPPETGLLNVYCTKPPVALENPDCYHTYQVYMR